MNEIFKPIKDYPLYEVSNYGTIRSWVKPGCKGGLLDYPRILKGSRHVFGYRLAKIQNKEGRKCKETHRLVLETFGPPQPTKKHCCCHNDGDPQNNYIGNLRWGTQKENLKDMDKHGTRFTFKGEDSWFSKLTEEKVKLVRYLRTLSFTHAFIGELYNVNEETVRSICRRKTWKHVK